MPTNTVSHPSNGHRTPYSTENPAFSLALAMRELNNGVGNIKVPLASRLPRPSAEALLNRTALTTANSGALVETRPESLTWIDALRARSILARAGALLTTNAGASAMIVVTSPPTAEWVGETSTATEDSSLALTQIGEAPRTIVGAITFSEQLARQATKEDQLDGVLLNLVARTIAAALDAASVAGNGVLQPQGLYGLTGVGSVAMGGAITFDKCAEMIQTLELANGDSEAATFVTTPQIAKAAGVTARTAGSSVNILERRGGAPELAGCPAIISSSVPTDLGVGANEHGIVYGDFRDVHVVFTGDVPTVDAALDVTVNRYTRARQKLVELTVAAYVDVRMLRPASFVTGTGLTAS